MKRKKLKWLMVVLVLSLTAASSAAFGATAGVPAIPEGNENLYDAQAGTLSGAMSGGVRKANVAADGSITPASVDEEDYYDIRTALNRETEFYAKNTEGDFVKTDVRKLSVYTKVQLEVQSFSSSGKAAWHGAGLVLKRGNEQAVRIRLISDFTQVLVQQSVDGQGENWAGATDSYFDSKFSGLEVGASLTLEALTEETQISVWVNGQLAVDKMEVTSKGKPAFAPYFINMGVKMSAIEQYFVQEVDLHYGQVVTIPEGNPDILRAPGYETALGERISGEEGVRVSFSEGVLSTDSKTFNGAYSLTNPLLEANLYDVKGGAKTAGRDLSMYLTASLHFGEYGGADGWEGLGLVFGLSEAGDKSYTLRLTQSGRAFVLERTLTEPQTETERTSASFSADVSQGATAEAAILNAAGKLSVWVNGNRIISEFDLGKTDPHAGGAFAKNAGRISHLYMSFTEPISVDFPRPGSQNAFTEGTGFSAGMYSATTAPDFREGVVTISDNSYNDIFLANAKGSGGVVYRREGENLIPVEQKNLSLTLEMTIEVGDFGSSPAGWHGLGLLFRSDGVNSYGIRFLKEGRVILTKENVASGGTELASKSINALEKGDVFEISVYSTPTAAYVSINGKTVFDNVALDTPLPNRAAVWVSHCTGEVRGIGQYYPDEIVFDKPASPEETYPEDPPKPPVNDEQILPDVHPASGIGLIVGGSVLGALALGGAAALFILWNKKKDREEK